MKASIGMFLAVFLAVQSNGQVYFDRLYDSGVFDVTVEGIWAPALKSGSGYSFVTMSRNGTLPEAQLTIYETNEWGEALNFRSHGASSMAYRPEGLIKTENGYAVFASYGTTDPILDYQFCLTFIDENLEVVEEFLFGDSLFRHNSIDMFRCFDDGFLMIGQLDSASTTADMLVVRTDRFGNMRWKKRYGGPSFESGWSAIETPDSGFLFLGWTSSFGAGQRDFYLVKTDSVGNQLWQRTYGSGGTELGCGIIETIDGNYILTGSGSQGSNTSIGRLYKIKPDGSILWARTYLYPGNSGNNLYKTIEMPNGDLVSVGLTDKNHNNNGGWLLRTDADGNVIWNREYNKNQHTDLFYSVLATDDGGFLLSGQARNEETLSQDAWLLKVDSVGCPYANCLVGVDEVEKGKVVVDVWPNPASEVVNIEWQNNGLGEVRVFDMTGNEILRKQTKQMRESIDVSQLPNGLYVLTVMQGETKANLKIVVQH